MEIINKITFDMAAAGMPTYIDAVQGDTLTRKVEVTLMKRGQVFDPSDGFVSVSVAFKKPDGTSGWYDTLPDGNTAATVISDGVYQVSLAPEMLTVPGNVYALFRFDLDGKTISTFPFVVRVSENPSFNSSKIENYYNVQTWDAVNASFDEVFDRLAKLEQSGGGSGGANIDDTKISTETTWSSQNIVDKLCPSFNKKGAVVECTPMVGYPLEVIAHVPVEAAGETVTMHHTGKNMLPNTAKSGTVHGVTFTVNEDGSIVANGTATSQLFLFIGNVVYPDLTKQYVISGSPSGCNHNTFSIYNPDGFDYVNGGKHTPKNTQQPTYITVLPGITLNNAVFKPMIRLAGTTAEYEPYRCDEKTVTIPADALEGTYNWNTGIYTEIGGGGGNIGTPQTIIAFPGVNCLWSSNGDTEVSGRTDPNSVIQDLYNKINALSTTMTALTGV